MYDSEPPVIREYLAMGPKSKCWAWATLVEEVALWRGLDADERQNEAIYCATNRVSKEFRRWPFKTPCEVPEVPHEFVDEIVSTISAEFDAVKKRAVHWGDDEARDSFPSLSAWFPADYLSIMLESEKMERDKVGSQRPNNAVYALYRNSQDRMPLYVGETPGPLKTRLRTHRWWGNHEMWVTFLEKPEFRNVGKREYVERVLMEACTPPANKKWRPKK